MEDHCGVVGLSWVERVADNLGGGDQDRLVVGEGVAVAGEHVVDPLGGVHGCPRSASKSRSAFSLSGLSPLLCLASVADVG